ncbi:MAG: Holliday junction branch migration protein RuvA [Ignavibacteria bacterium]|nr:Holliday junction branch migration protein RuvA [Ignavibacteria bacterium]
MIASIRGKLIFKGKNDAVLEAAGVGYHVFLSRTAAELLANIGEEYHLLTYLDVKENSLQLFGFSDSREKEIYRLLISVSGIGPKIAHSFLANFTFEEIIGAISSGGRGFPVKIPGLGQKKLELISMSLKDKIFKIGYDGDLTTPLQAGVFETDTSRLEALSALMNLGYQRTEAEKIIREVLKSSESAKISTEELIRKSLEFISK